MIARFLHRLSRRAGKPFVEVNCGALPENLVESELFGHEAGAFTGSLRTGKKGQFELANGGTIFLDEIGELSVASQAELLKVLDGKEIRPLGGASARQLDVRVICATNRNLRELVAKREMLNRYKARNDVAMYLRDRDSSAPAPCREPVQPLPCDRGGLALHVRELLFEGIGIMAPLLKFPKPVKIRRGCHRVRTGLKNPVFSPVPCPQPAVRLAEATQIELRNIVMATWLLPCAIITARGARLCSSSVRRADRVVFFRR